jgi:hypothetical protein
MKRRVEDDMEGTTDSRGNRCAMKLRRLGNGKGNTESRNFTALVRGARFTALASTTTASARHDTILCTAYIDSRYE